MRKHYFFFSFASFAIFTLLGYLTAIDGFPRLGSREVSMAGPSALAVQQNLLLIQVDRLDSDRPTLQAAWIAGYFRSPNQTVLTYYPLVTENTAKIAEKNLAALFTLNKDGSPGGVFLQAIAAKGIKTLGYLIIDEQGFSTLDKMLHPQYQAVNYQPNSRTRRLLDASCHTILAGPAPRSNLKLDKSTLAGHLQTNLVYNDLVEAWNRLLKPDHTARCEILP